jgi:hypothetical protein
MYHKVNNAICVDMSWHSRGLAACRLVMDGQPDSTDQDHAEAAAALLAADGGLRAALAEGLALFALAAARRTGTAAPAGENSPCRQQASRYWQLPQQELDAWGTQAAHRLYASISAGALPHAASAQQLAADLLQEVAARHTQVQSRHQ